MRRRGLLRGTVALVAIAAVTLASGCSSSSPKPSNKLEIWALQDAGMTPIVKASISRYNDDSSGPKAALTTYVNDPYKQKIRSALGSSAAPDVFYNWGGGNLSQFVKANQVTPLDDALAKQPDVVNAFLPSVLEVGRINGKQYGLPMTGVQPVILYYNKTMFAEYGLRPPKTFDQLMSLVKKFVARGITPISLPGKQPWTEMMYPEYFLDRLGGPSKFKTILAQGGAAWQDPDVIKAIQLSQDLVEAGAFGTNYDSIDYDGQGASKIFAAGKAAMYVMGTWDTANQSVTNPGFVKRDLAWTAFPTVAGGTGPAGDLIGNPSNYFSVAASSTHKDQAINFLTSTLASDTYIGTLIKAGQVPTTVGIESKLSSGPNANFNQFTYNLVKNAPTFSQSWDQALSPSIAARLLTDLQQVFQLAMTPEAFGADMAQAE